jgi:VIT1/CCC1 family predicted Fe2+/Mn2+ transporter
MDDRRAALRDELDSAALYDALSTQESNPRLAEVYRRLAASERRHADAIAAQLRESGVAVVGHRSSFRTRTLIWLAWRFGPAFILPSLAAAEDAHGLAYAQEARGDGQDAAARTTAAGVAAGAAGEERSHARLLRELARTPGGLEGSAVAQLEGRHRTAGGNALRAAVLGANDGLVSNLSLVMGVAGADLSGRAILISGLAGLLAGAFSMALGEWLSVQSSRELYQHQIGLERAELESSPEEEREELALIYQARGLTEVQARATADQIIGDRGAALDTLVREELGIDPKELGGSAWEAAITSFVLFAIGAVVPVIPFMFLAGGSAVGASLALSALGLFAIGGGITLFTGRPMLASGTRQVLFGLAAAAATYLVGRLIGVTIAG